MLAPGPGTLCSVAGLHHQHKVRLWHHAEARATPGAQSRTVSKGVGAKAVAALIVSIATTAVILASGLPILRPLKPWGMTSDMSTREFLAPVRRQHVKAMGKKKESKAERILRQVACGACTPPHL